MSTTDSIRMRAEGERKRRHRGGQRLESEHVVPGQLARNAGECLIGAPRNSERRPAGQTGKPVNGAAVQLTPSGPLQLFAAHTMAGPSDAQDITTPGLQLTDEQGSLKLEKLVPGQYAVEMFGLEKTVVVRPGEQAFRVRGELEPPPPPPPEEEEDDGGFLGWLTGIF